MNKIKKQPVPNNSSYAMRVSEVLQVQFSQASFVSVDTDVATKSRTAHSCDRYRKYEQKILANGSLLMYICTT